MTVMDKIQMMIENAIDNINTMFPAIVVAVNKCTCDVKPKFYYEIAARATKFKREMPILRDVPVVWVRGGNSIIKVPIKENDVVLVGCSQVSLRKMLTDVTEVQVSRTGTFYIEDAFILGGFVLGNEVDTTIYGSEKFEIPTELTIVSDGEIVIEAPSINFNWNETKGVTWEQLSSDPGGLGTGDKGRRWFNTTSNQFKGWNGVSVVVLG